MWILSFIFGRTWGLCGSTFCCWLSLSLTQQLLFEPGIRYSIEFLERLENWAWLLASFKAAARNGQPLHWTVRETSLPLPFATPWTPGMDSKTSSEAEPGSPGASLMTLVRFDLSLQSHYSHWSSLSPNPKQCIFLVKDRSHAETTYKGVLGNVVLAFQPPRTRRNTRGKLERVLSEASPISTPP